MNKPKVSVIIPVYNTEKYLKKCLDSIVNQTLEDIEILCVNDGSTDKSLEILKNYANRDTRIRIFDQNNQGQGAARNKALKIASGEFVGFVDSDDCIENNMYEILYEKAKNENLEILMCQIKTYNDVTKEYGGDKYLDVVCIDGNLDEILFSHKDTLKDSLYISVTPVNKLYNLDFLKKNNIQFPEDMKFEDEIFFHKVYLKANRVSILRKKLYTYRINREFSTMHNKSDYFLDILKFSKIIKQLYMESDKKEAYAPYIYNRLIERIVTRFNILEDELKISYFDDTKKGINEILIGNESFLTKDLKFKVDKLLKANDPLKSNNFKVSIIIPVYNNEKNLKKCLDSIVNQSLEDIEILCVNDGSTDKSVEVLEKYSHDIRLKIIHQKNQGKAAARNNALMLATGEYIGFVDPDDYIDEDMYQILYETSKKDDLDIIMCKVYPFDNITSEYSEKYSSYYSLNQLKDFENQVFSYKALNNSLFTIPIFPCNKLFRRELLSKENINFPTGVLFEDYPFYFDSILNSEKISFINKDFYNLRVKKNHLSFYFNNISSINNSISIFEYCMNIFIKNNLYDYYELMFLNFWISFLSKKSLDSTDKNYKDIFFKRIKNLYLNLNISPFVLRKTKENIQKLYIFTLNSNGYEDFSKKLDFNYSIEKDEFWNKAKYLSDSLLTMDINGEPIEILKTDNMISITIESELFKQTISENFRLKSELDIINDTNLKLKNELNVLNNELTIKDKKLYLYCNSIKRPLKEKCISFLYPLYILIKNNNGFKNSLNTIRAYRKIKKAGFFDEDYYLDNNFDVFLRGVDPLLHYIYFGHFENRKPNSNFDGQFYCNTYKDVKEININNLVNFTLFGSKENRKTKNN